MERQPGGEGSLPLRDALRESEERFRVMSDHLPLIVWVHDADGKQEFVNRTFEEFFGVTAEESRGDGWQLLMHPEDAEAYAAEFQSCTAERRFFHARVRVRRQDGEWRWIESWGQPRITSSGQFLGFVGSSADVTEQRLAEERLLRSEQRFRELADSMPQLVWTADSEGRVDYYNERVDRYAGLTENEEDGWHWAPLVHPHDLERTEEAWQAALERGETYACDHRIAMADGTYRWHLSRGRPVHDPESGETRWFGTATDVEDLKRTEAALRRADEEKNAFLATVAHELRNPLSALRSVEALLADREEGATSSGAADPLIRRSREVLDKQLSLMGRLVDDLLDLSRLGRFKLRLRSERVELQDVVRRALDTAEPLLRSRGHHLDLSLPREPVRIHGDRERLTQIVTNLVNNAALYMEPRGLLSLRLSTDDEHAELCVADEGAGLEEEQLERIFEPFFQVRDLDSQDRRGMGLGLALVRQLVELHGGTVHARGEGLGRGSQFVVRLPRSE